MKVESATAPSHQKDIDDDRHACLLNVAQTNAGCGLSEESQRYDYVIEGERREGFWQFLTRNWQECSNYHWAIRSFIANNLSRKYRRSVLGFLWGFLAPLMTLAIMSTMFSLIFHMNPERSVKYIFSGLIAWSFISESALQGAGCLISAESFLKKLAIPKLFFPLVSVGTDTVNCLLNMMSLIALAAILGIEFKHSILVLPVVISITAIYNLGIALIYSVGTVHFRDLPHILSVTYPALFYALPVFYPMSSVPSQYHWIFYCNPLFWFINLFRHIIHDGTLPNALEWCIPMAIALFTLSCGLFVLSRNNRILIYRL